MLRQKFKGKSQKVVLTVLILFAVPVLLANSNLQYVVSAQDSCPGDKITVINNAKTSLINANKACTEGDTVVPHCFTSTTVDGDPVFCPTDGVMKDLEASDNVQDCLYDVWFEATGGNTDADALSGLLSYDGGTVVGPLVDAANTCGALNINQDGNVDGNDVLKCNQGVDQDVVVTVRKAAVGGNSVDIQTIGCIALPVGQNQAQLYYSLNGAPCNSSSNKLTVVNTTSTGTIQSNATTVDLGTASTVNVCAGDTSGGATVIDSGSYSATPDASKPPIAGANGDDADGFEEGAQGVEACALNTTGELNDYCVACIEAKATWTAIGCIETNAQGVFTALIRVGVGTMGGVALVRMIGLGYLYQFGTEKQIEETKSGVFSTLAGIVTVVMSVVTLRIVGSNILDAVPSGFF